MTKDEIKETIKNKKIIAILRNIGEDKLFPIVEALYQGGIRVLEVTYSQNGTISDDDTEKNIHNLVEKMFNKMLIGAGTVLTEKQVERTKRAGGCFIISPDTNKNVINKTNELEMVSIPGALTPTEIKHAYDLGADFVKIFPSSAFGPSYIKAIKAPLSNIDLLSVGGVDLNNINDFYNAGVCGFGIGSNILDKKMIENNDYEGLKELAKKYVSEVEKLK